MSRKIEINQDILLDLAAGNLTGEAYRELLLALEAQPQHWRTCALILLEEQSLHQELRSIAAGNDLSPVDAQDSIRAAEEANRPATPRTLTPCGSQTPLTKAELASSPNSKPSSRQRSWRSATTLMTLAVVLLLSFGSGWSISVWQHGEQEDGVAGLASDSPVPGDRSTTAQPMGSSQSAGDRRLADQQQVDDIRNVSAEEDWLPQESYTIGSGTHRLVSSGDVLPIDRQVPATLRELERRGQVRIETFDALVPVALDDGSSALVPMQEFRVTPVTYAY